MERQEIEGASSEPPPAPPDERRNKVDEQQQPLLDHLAVLAHELRNPLAPIRNALQVIRLCNNDPPLVEQMRAMAERQVFHLTRLLDDLLDLSRVSSGRITLRKQVIDVSEAIQQAVEAIDFIARERDLSVSVHLPPLPLAVEADPTRLQQILGNLLFNAVKYTDPGGSIALTASGEGGEVVLRVRDSGIGMAPEILPRVFELFVQGERRLDRAHGGLGVGLTLVRQLVQMHGGSVTAHSDGRGKGSEFVIRLPAVCAERTTAPVQRPPAPAQIVPTSTPRHILVVDDNEDAAVTLALLLRLVGHQVRVAHSGPTALAAAQSEPPEIVLLDLGMPGMDGFEVARQLRGQPASKEVVLVAVTGWAQDSDRQRCFEAGFDGHLPKPVDWDALQQFLNHPRVASDRIHPRRHTKQQEEEKQ